MAFTGKNLRFPTQEHHHRNFQGEDSGALLQQKDFQMCLSLFLGCIFGNKGAQIREREIRLNQGLND